MTSKVFLIGFMGSGKTYWGKRWAKENGLNFFDLDDEIEKAAGQKIVNIFKTKGEEHFRELEKEVLRQFADHNNFIVACGGGTPCFFDNLRWMNEQGVTIYLEATATQIVDRIRLETGERPLLKNMNESELMVYVEQKLQERGQFYIQAKHSISVDKLYNNSLGNLLKIN